MGNRKKQRAHERAQLNQLVSERVKPSIVEVAHASKGLAKPLLDKVNDEFAVWHEDEYVEFEEQHKGKTRKFRLKFANGMDMFIINNLHLLGKITDSPNLNKLLQRPKRNPIFEGELQTIESRLAFAIQLCEELKEVEIDGVKSLEWLPLTVDDIAELANGCDVQAFISIQNKIAEVLKPLLDYAVYRELQAKKA